MFNTNNRYTLYNSRYCKNPELYGTSMAVYLIMRAGLFPKGVFTRQGLFSREPYAEWGLNRSFTELLLIKKKQMGNKKSNL